jgi:hypothetical protein
VQRRIVSNHHHRVDRRGDGLQALEKVVGVEGVDRIVRADLDVCAQTRPDDRERVLRPTRGRTQDERWADLAVPHVPTDALGGSLASRGERAVTVVEGGVVPAGLGVAEEQQRLHVDTVPFDRMLTARS